MTADEQLRQQQARDVGWLEGFATTVWALVSAQSEPPIVADDAACEYERIVARLRDSIGIDGTEVDA